MSQCRRNKNQRSSTYRYLTSQSREDHILIRKSLCEAVCVIESARCDSPLYSCRQVNIEAQFEDGEDPHAEKYARTHGGSMRVISSAQYATEMTRHREEAQAELIFTILSRFQQENSAEGERRNHIVESVSKP